MKTFSIVIAGVLLASMSFASQGDPGREDRFQAKTGRSAPVAGHQTAAAEKCGKDCCPRHESQNQPANGNQAFADAWSRAKFGRVIRPVENQSGEKLAKAVLAKSEAPVSSSCDAKCCE